MVVEDDGARAEEVQPPRGRRCRKSTRSATASTTSPRKTDAPRKKVNKVVRFHEGKKKHGSGGRKAGGGLCASEGMLDLMLQFGVMIRQITSHPWAQPFLQPVDVVGLQLDDYHKIITKPMDFSTIKNKMEGKDGPKYNNVREIYADVRLILANAMKYNNEHHDVHITAKIMLGIFEEKWIQLLPQVVNEERKLEEESNYVPSTSASPEEAVLKLAEDKDHGPRKKVNKVVRFHDGKKHVSGGRKSGGGSRYVAYGGRDGGNSEGMLDLMRQFGVMICQITSDAFAEPFLQPVDVIGLQLDDYHKIITKPMDFSTIQNRMEGKDGPKYNNVREIYADVRLIFANAMKYNDKQHAVHIMAKCMLERFEKKWIQLLPEVEKEEMKLKEEPNYVPSTRASPEVAISKLAEDTDHELENKVNEVVRFYDGKKHGTGGRKAGGGRRQVSYGGRDDSNCKGMPDLIRQFGVMIREITSDAWAEPFLRPIDAVGLQLDDYYKIITKPMDFSTIQNKMEGKDGPKYNNVREIYADVRLIFANAMKYHDEQHCVHIMAKCMLKRFENKWIQLLPKVENEEMKLKEEPNYVPSTSTSREEAISELIEDTDHEVRPLIVVICYHLDLNRKF